METIILISSAIGLAGARYVAKIIKYKYRKYMLRMKLYDSLEGKSENLLKHCLAKLSDFDKKNNTNKLESYVNKFINKYGDKAGVNGDKLRKYIKGACDFVEIYEIIEEDDMEDTIKLQLEKASKVLSEVERKRKEILIRKNKIRTQSVLKSMKLNRISGKMG